MATVGIVSTRGGKGIFGTIATMGRGAEVILCNPVAEDAIYDLLYMNIDGGTLVCDVCGNPDMLYISMGDSYI